ncbi:MULTISPECIES: fimbrial protein [Enterobacterales]|uniref:fimbrial protein n=1 Tax=Enterobacterales TaxID=91347 RepID=UPI002EDA0D53
MANSEETEYEQIQLSFFGSVKAAPCVIEGGSTMSVDLGKKLQMRFLNQPGAASSWVEFAMNLINCPNSTTEVTATYSGAPSESGDRYANTGTARNVDIELQRADGQNLGNGKTYIVAVNPVTAAASLAMRARVYTAAGNATAGTINGTVSISLTYK